MIGRSAVVVLVVASIATFAACGWDWTVVPKGIPSDSGDAGDAATAQDGGPEGGVKASCRSNDDCVSEEVCVFPDYRCGAGVEGSCIPRNAACLGDISNLACGCDGQIEKDRCSVRPKGTDLSIEAKCTPPAGTFRCGFLFCNDTEYCFEARTPSLVEFVCIPWECPERACTCPEWNLKCPVSTCSAQANGGTLVVCTETEDE